MAIVVTDSNTETRDLERTPKAFYPGADELIFTDHVIGLDRPIGLFFSEPNMSLPDVSAWSGLDADIKSAVMADAGCGRKKSGGPGAGGCLIKPAGRGGLRAAVRKAGAEWEERFLP